MESPSMAHPHPFSPASPPHNYLPPNDQLQSGPLALKKSPHTWNPAESFSKHPTQPRQSLKAALPLLQAKPSALTPQHKRSTSTAPQSHFPRHRLHPLTSNSRILRKQSTPAQSQHSHSLRRPRLSYLARTSLSQEQRIPSPRIPLGTSSTSTDSRVLCTSLLHKKGR